MAFIRSEIFSIIVARNNPLTRKIRADDKAFLLSGREKLPSEVPPFVLLSVGYKKKEGKSSRMRKKRKRKRQKSIRKR